jgi:hypothetical protein
MVFHATAVAVGRCVKEFGDPEEHRISGRILSGEFASKIIWVQRAARMIPWNQISREELFPPGLLIEISREG